jgi:hypothetical protein
MKALPATILASALLAVACSSDPVPNTADASADAASDGTITTDGSGGDAKNDGTSSDGSSGGPSTDPTKPTPLTVGTPVAGTLQPGGTPVPPDYLPAPGSVHYFSFTVPTTGRYTVSVQGAIQGGHCPTSAAAGCLCQQGPVFTCCTPGDAGTCSYTCEKGKNVDWPQGTVIYPYASNQGAGTKPYTITITGPI